MTLVSDNIRYLRKLNGLTQEQFSRKINIKRSLLGAYEEGRANPNGQNMQAIAKAFNTTVELLTRQDLRKLRETPNLSIPLGQAGRPAESRPPTIRTDGKIDPDEDDPFQHPDFPDIFAQPTPPAPEPQPLSSVLNKYYKTQDDAPRPVPPVITSPVVPGQPRPAAERLQPTAYQSGPAKPAGRLPADELFSLQPEFSSGMSSSPARQADTLTFNNIYEGTGNAARPNLATQSVAQTIPVVMQRQFAEYGQRSQQADFLHRLPAMHLPTLPEGHYRAFEAGDDFTFPGALLIGKFIKNWFDIADGKLYVLLVHQQSAGSGIYCRRVYNQVKVKGTLLTTADRADVPNREVALKDVLEVWEVCAFVSQKLPPPAPNTDRLRQLVDELRFEVERL
ncbi:helix-turn-helix domain-containing protein [Spirosoma areae]